MGSMPAEQHIVFLTGRPFRRSVLVRHPALPRARREPQALRLQALHLACLLRLDTADSMAGQAVFRDAAQRSVTTRDPLVRDALLQLAAAYPAILSLDALAAGEVDAPSVHAARVKRVADALLTLVQASQVDIASLPLRIGTAVQTRPYALAPARLEAASGQPSISSLRHVGIPARPLLQTILPWLDGAQDRATLHARLATVLASGALAAPVAAAGASPDDIAEQHLNLALGQLARLDVLEAG